MTSSEGSGVALSTAPTLTIRKRASTWWPIVAYLVFGALALSPLLWAAVPPLIDFPDHLARMAVLANHDPAAAITTNYVVHWRLLPNLAMDLIVPILAQIMPLEVAGRVFVAAIMIMLVAGTALLHLALHGRIGLWPLCPVLFLYNDVLAWGFVNYLFGLGVSLLSLSLWIASAAWPKSVRLAVFAVIAAIILVLHLFAFGVFGLLVGSYEVGLALAERPLAIRNFLRRASTLLLFIPAGLLWLASLSNMGVLYTAQGGLDRKLEVWLRAPSFNEPMAPLDDLILAVTVGFLIFGFATRRLILAPAMRVSIGAAVITAVLMPEWVSGSWGADLRLPVALLFILVGATRLDVARMGWSIATFALIGCLLFGLRIAAVTLGWHAMDRQFAEFRGAIRTLPEGVRMMTVQSAWPREAHNLDGVPEALQFRADTAFWHLDTLAVIDRGVFVTGLFTDNSTVSVSSRNEGLERSNWKPLTPEELSERVLPIRGNLVASAAASDGLPPCCYDWPRVYDFVFWIDFGHAPAQLSRFLEPWGKGSYFHIYRVTRP
jgi:hypothetical protein